MVRANPWLLRLYVQQLMVRSVMVVAIPVAPNAVSNAIRVVNVLSAPKVKASAVMAVAATRAVAAVANVQVNVVLSAVTNHVLIRATKHAPSLGMSLVLRVAQKAAAHVLTLATRAMKHV